MKNSLLDYGSFVSYPKNKTNASDKVKQNESDVIETLESYEELPEENNQLSQSKNSTEEIINDALDEISNDLNSISVEFVPVQNYSNASSEKDFLENVSLSLVEKNEESEKTSEESKVDFEKVNNSDDNKLEEENTIAKEAEYNLDNSVADNEEIIGQSENQVMDWEVPFDDDYSSVKKFENNGDTKQDKKAQKKLEKKNKKEQKLLEKQNRKNEKKSSKREKTNFSNEDVKNQNSVSNVKDSENYKKSNQKVKRPIGIVLIAIISIIVILSLTAVTIVVSKTTTDDTIVTAETTNRTKNDRAAGDCDSRLSSVISSIEMFYYLVDSFSGENAAISSTGSKFFEGNKDVGAVYFASSDKKFVNYQFFGSNEIETSMFDNYLVQESELINSIVPGMVQIENTSPFFGTSTLAIFCSYSSQSQNEKVVILLSTESIQENLANDPINLSFVVNNKGQILIHPDVIIMKQGQNYSEHPVVARMLSPDNSSLNEQFTYVDSNENEVIGAYSIMSTGGCAVITEVQTAIILEGVKNTIIGNIYLTVAILAISILIIWIFSSSLSNPLKALTAVTNEINQGNFNTELFNDLNDKRKDEIGVLIRSTKAERKMLNSVTRLTNPAVTRAIIRDEIDTAAHFKDITIFFSDIRGFTEKCDQFDKRCGKNSAAEIVRFLNEYMDRMVTCIAITGGTIDKYEGDAIMAAWGVLRNDDLDFENLPDSDPQKSILQKQHMEHVLEDAVNAIRAGIGMRYSLMKYNKDAELLSSENYDKYMPIIKIGAGFNTGRATVGFIGSEKYKLDHSSIGDAVNLASRTESSNKLCGTDMLITENTYNILKQRFIRCEENNFTIANEDLINEIVVEQIPATFEVKGKGAQHFYGIVNMPAFDAEEFFKAEGSEFANPDFVVDEDCLKAVGPKGPKSLNDVRAILDIPVPDFSGVNLNEEENKIKIK